MKLQHLRFFIAVVDCGGVVRAAARLRISQPSISAGLKALEEELGQTLFRRRGAGRSLRPRPKRSAFMTMPVKFFANVMSLGRGLKLTNPDSVNSVLVFCRQSQVTTLPSSQAH